MSLVVSQLGYNNYKTKPLGIVLLDSLQIAIALLFLHFIVRLGLMDILLSVSAAGYHSD